MIKSLAKILSTLAVMILLTTSAQAADLTEKFFVEQATLTPPRLRQPVPPALKAPRRDYPSRVPVRPAPRYIPTKPKPSRDNRGRFIPRAPQR